MKNPNLVIPMRVAVAGGSKAGKSYRLVAGMPGTKKLKTKPKDRVGGIPSSAAHNLVYHGGKTIRNLVYANFYIGGKNSWNTSDIENIDWALEEAMKDRYLNNVMRQYFDNKTIGSVFKSSAILPGSKPAKFTEGDVVALVKTLYKNKMLKGYRYANTVFNFMLPKGTELTDDAAASVQVKSANGTPVKKNAITAEDEDTSLEGLGGYHGSVHVNSKTKIYYAVGVYSCRMNNGDENGIVAFAQPWKNIVATFYHELCETRTDADVDDANNTGKISYCGWLSKTGRECGDYPMEEVGSNLELIMQEVPLANGQGIVPVQFQYSNAVNGPEGPIKYLHELEG